MGAFACFCARAQVSWHEEFSDSSLAANPTWTGDTSLFIHSNGQLHLNDSDGGVAEISTQSNVSSQGHWSGWLAMDFNPSGSNYCEVVLCEDATGRAYLLRFGGNSQDRISLIYALPGIEYELIRSTDGLLSSAQIELEWSISRYPDSLWIVEVNLNQSGWQTVGQSPDSLAFASEYFKLRCFYTKTRADKFKFDDLAVSGFPFSDTVTPYVVGSEWLNRYTVDVELSEKYYSDSISILDHLGREWRIINSTHSGFQLKSSVAVGDGLIHFDFSPIHDAYDNHMSTWTTLLSRPKPRSLVINEIMTDPEPVVGIAYEYVELFNASSDTVSLRGWTLVVNSSSQSLSDVSLAPMSYKALSLSIPNAECVIKLKDDWEEDIDEVQFNSDLHSTVWKIFGGWSLERDEPAPLQDLEFAWSSSLSERGGTPGEANMPERTTRHPLNSLLGYSMQNDSALFYFAVGIDSLYWNGEKFKPFDVRGALWHLPVLKSTNTLQTLSQSSYEIDTTQIQFPVTIGKPEGIFISEVLFDPVDGVPEFVEIVNSGPNATLLSDLRISKWSLDFGIEELHPLLEHQQPILPNEVVVITSDDASALFEEYAYSNRRANLSNSTFHSYLPFALGSSSGLCLTTSNGEIVDSIEWTPNSYHSHLDETKGLSLFRKSPAFEWQSSNTHRATPGVHHSESFELTASPQIINARFSPNGDQFKDAVQINLPTKWESWVISFDVLTASGQKVASVLDGKIVSVPTVVSWDGKNNGSSLPAGQYLLSIKAENASGQVEIWRHGCLLIDE